ncbi:MAG: Smr/MutS family protein [bacterium]
MRPGREAGKTIDLHGLTEPEALRKLVRDYNAYVRGGGRDPVWIVHGYGSSGRGGVLQQAVRLYIGAHVGRFDKVVEGDALANPGVTLVYPKRLLPEVVTR